MDTLALATALLEQAWGRDPALKPRSAAAVAVQIRALTRIAAALLAAAERGDPAAFATRCRCGALVLGAIGGHALAPLLPEVSARLSALRPGLTAPLEDCLGRDLTLDLPEWEVQVASALQQPPPALVEPWSETDQAWLAAATVAIHALRDPGERAFDSDQGARCLEDARRHVTSLAAAVTTGSSAAFREYSRWAELMLGFTGHTRSLPALYDDLANAARLVLPETLGDLIGETLAAGAESAREGVTPAALSRLAPRAAVQAALDGNDDWRTAVGDDLARLAVALYYLRHPKVSLDHGETGRATYLADAARHLDHLAEAFAVSSQPLFVDYLAWVRCASGVPEPAIQDLLACLKEALRLVLPGSLGEQVAEFVRASDAVVSSAPPPTQFDTSSTLGRLGRRFHDLLVSGDRRRASQLVLTAAEDGVPVRDLYLGVFQPSQYEIGRRWQLNQITVAQEHLATAATQLIMSQLYPRVFTTERTGKTLVGTCSAEDLHELGVRMVCDLFELAGWDTYYLGAACPIQDVIETLQQHSADVLAISATLATHLRHAAALIKRVRADPRTRAIKILIGGLPFQLDPSLWRTLGADGSASDCGTAVEAGERLVQQSP